MKTSTVKTMMTLSRRTAWLVSLALSGLYAQVAAASPAAHGPEAHGITWFNWPSQADPRIGLGYLLINFLVLAFLLHRLLIRKLVADNATRHDTIKAQVEAAQRAQREAEGVLAEYKAKVDRLEQETKEILAQAQTGAEADRQRLFSEARAEVERFKAQALSATQREVLRRRQEVENEVLERAISRATELLRARFTDADQARLVDQFITGTRPEHTADVGGGR